MALSYSEPKRNIMKLSIWRNLSKITSFLIIIFTLPMPVALADSIYDGIWQTGRIADGIWQTTAYSTYYSITITGNTVLLISFFDVAKYQDPLRGAYMGSLPSTIDNLLSSPENPLSIRVVLDESIPKTTFYENTLLPMTIFYSWQVNFVSKDSATIHRPWKDYPTTDFPPPFALRKIF